jgi:hypothetical protein
MSTDNGFSDYRQQQERREALAARLRLGTRTQLFDALASHGIARVNVTFDGEGDSGQIEETTALRTDDQPADLPDQQLTVQVPNPDATGPQDHTLSLADLIEELCYDLLGEHHGGWQDNDGSYGEFVLDVADRSITLDMNERFTDSHNSSHCY